MNTINHSAFSTAEHHFKSILNRIEYYNDMANACVDLDRSLEVMIYVHLRDGEINVACDLVDLCYRMDFLTRTDAFNVRHWLYWFNDPDRLEPESGFFEDFRYPEDNR